MLHARLTLVLSVLLSLAGTGQRTACGQGSATLKVNPIEDPFVLGGAGERIDSTLRGLVPLGFSGAAFAYKDGLVVFHGAYGEANREDKIANTVGTLFPLGSLENEFLFAAILRLEEDGELQIDDSVRRVIDNARSGSTGAANARRMTEIVESASGLPIRQYITQRLFERTGMTHTVFSDAPGAPVSLMARGYTAPRGTFRLLERFPWLSPLLRPSLRKVASRLKPATPDASGESGTLGIRSTVGDLFLWRLALQGGDLLGEEARERLRDWIDGSARKGESAYQVEGVSSGHRLAILADPRRHLVLIVAANNDLGWPTPAILGIEKNLYGAADKLLTFTVLAICVAALLLVLGVSQHGKRGSFGRRSRPSPFPF
jgi:CubicO group peptidase (beta-lactamase class C family)